MKYKYEGQFPVAVPKNGFFVTVNPGDVIELEEAPNRNFKEVKEKKVKTNKKSMEVDEK